MEVAIICGPPITNLFGRPLTTFNKVRRTYVNLAKTFLLPLAFWAFAYLYLLISLDMLILAMLICASTES